MRGIAWQWLVMFGIGWHRVVVPCMEAGGLQDISRSPWDGEGGALTLLASLWANFCDRCPDPLVIGQRRWCVRPLGLSVRLSPSQRPEHYPDGRGEAQAPPEGPWGHAISSGAHQRQARPTNAKNGQPMLSNASTTSTCQPQETISHQR